MTPPRSGRSGLARRARLAFDTLLPTACVGCGRGVASDDAPLCGPCASRLPRLPRPRCERCAEPLGRLPRGAPFRRCGTCEEWPDDLVAADAPYAFRDGGASVVRALKYGRWTSLAALMARDMAAPARGVLERLAWPPARLVVVPVPLASSRLRERGFNQAELLAGPLAAALGAPLVRALAREPGGRRQAGLSGGARQSNVEGRFVARRGPDRPPAHALLVDDVLTTGATALACATALVEAGFERAALVTFARTPRPLVEDRWEGRRPLVPPGAGRPAPSESRGPQRKT